MTVNFKNRDFLIQLLNYKKYISLISACLLVSGIHAHEVIGISDGDTMTILVDRKPVKIRLANIDAPEKKQPYSERSKQSLSSMCWGTDATFIPELTDVYGRTVAVVKCDGIEVNRAQVQSGMAWVYPKYNKDVGLPGIEKGAKLKAIGLWVDQDAIPPWEFRKQISEGVHR